MIQGVYRHYKGGIYYVLGFALLEATMEELVIYSDKNGYTWARPKSEFESFVMIEGENVQRFTYIKNPNVEVTSYYDEC